MRRNHRYPGTLEQYTYQCEIQKIHISDDEPSFLIVRRSDFQGRSFDQTVLSQSAVSARTQDSGEISAFLGAMRRSSCTLLRPSGTAVSIPPWMTLEIGGIALQPSRALGDHTHRATRLGTAFGIVLRAKPADGPVSPRMDVAKYCRYSYYVHPYSRYQ
jgi:hypothetical protein